jgi:hypothetical protein
VTATFAYLPSTLAIRENINIYGMDLKKTDGTRTIRSLCLRPNHSTDDQHLLRAHLVNDSGKVAGIASRTLSEERQKMFLEAMSNGKDTK